MERLLVQSEFCIYIFYCTNINNNIIICIDIVVFSGGVSLISVHSLLTEAIGETEVLEPGEVFLVRDLFKGYLWNRIPRGDRLLLGSLFLSYVGSNECSVSLLDKGASGQQRYRKD